VRSGPSWPLLSALLAGFIGFGAVVTLIGATLPKIIADFGWSYTQAGLVMAAGAGGYLLSCLLAGPAIHHLGPRPAAVAGQLLQAAGLALFGGSPSVAANAVLWGIVGMGQGGIEVVTNVSVGQMEKPGQSRLMNFVHASFCVGAIVGPMAVGRILASHLSWRLPFHGMAAVAVVTAGVFAFCPFGRLLGPAGAVVPGEPDGRPGAAWSLFRQPLLALLVAVLLVYVGVELGISAWVSEYSVKVLRFPAGLAANMVAVFWSGLLVGRVAVFFGYHGTRQAELLCLLSAATTAILATALLLTWPPAVAAAVFATGLACSAIYPVAMGLIGRHFARNMSLAMALGSAGGAVGSLLFPFLMSALSDAAGLRNGFWFYVGLAVLMLALAICVLAAARRRENGDATALLKTGKLGTHPSFRGGWDGPPKTASSHRR